MEVNIEESQRSTVLALPTMDTWFTKNRIKTSIASDMQKPLLLMELVSRHKYTKSSITYCL